MKKTILLIFIGIFIVGILSAIILLGDYEKVRDIDKIDSKKACKELVKWELIPEDTDCNEYKDKNLEGSELSIIEVNPETLENNVYIVRFGE
ncbi:MAG: hypothetical protein E3J83_05065 [Candidatus Atribacteria bacterium]|nr:MAG: hypothetical protein E3J83_05065 [Candidatus Atribacteria bacterium]